MKVARSISRPTLPSLRELWKYGLALLLLLLPFVIGAEPRFPPPEFDTPHQIPATSVPAARVIWLQYMDVLVLLASLALAAWFVYKKRSRRLVYWLGLFSVLY